MDSYLVGTLVLFLPVSRSVSAREDGNRVEQTNSSNFRSRFAVSLALESFAQ